MPQFPAVDPIPLPAPVWLFKFLHDLTFTLHLCSVELLVGGLIFALLMNAVGRARTSEGLLQASGMIAHRLPTVMAFVINLGIPPLLFAQVLYGRALYTSSVLIGVFWISVIFLLMASYFGLYFAAKRADSARPWTMPGVAALLLVLTIAFIYSNNMTLMIRPQAWISMYQSSPTGAQLNTADPTLWPRWLFMIAGTFAGGGAGMVLLSLRRGAAQEALRRWGGFAIVVGVIDQAAFARLTLNAQAQDVFGTVMNNALYRDFAYAWVAAAGLLLVFGVVAFTVRTAGAAVAIVCAVAAFLNVAATVMVRDGIRDATLRNYGFDVWNRAVVTNWSVVGIFGVLLVAAAGVIFYLIKIVAGARPIKERYV